MLQASLASAAVECAFAGVPGGRSVTAASEHATRLQRLVSAGAFEVGVFHCPGTPENTEIECAPYPEVVVPQFGTYLWCDESGDILLNRATVGFFEARRPYSIRHFRPEPDRTTVISIVDVEALHDAIGVRLTNQRAFARAACALTGEITFHHRCMLYYAQRGDLLPAQEHGAALIVSALQMNVTGAPDLTRQSRPRSARDPRIRVDLALRFLERSFRAPITLEDLSRAAGLSVFHLSRTFLDLTGSTIHQHVITLRLDAALQALLGTSQTVTEIAHETGFSSHAHMTTLFKKRFGVTPKAVRLGARQ